MVRRSPGAPQDMASFILGLWLIDADCCLTYMDEPPKGMNRVFPKEESRGGRGSKRVVRDVRGELGLRTWGRLPSSLVTSLGEGGLLAGARSWSSFPVAVWDGDHMAVSFM